MSLEDDMNKKKIDLDQFKLTNKDHAKQIIDSIKKGPADKNQKLQLHKSGIDLDQFTNKGHTNQTHHLHKSIKPIVATAVKKAAVGMAGNNLDSNVKGDSSNVQSKMQAKVQKMYEAAKSSFARIKSTGIPAIDKVREAELTELQNGDKVKLYDKSTDSTKPFTMHVDREVDPKTHKLIVWSSLQDKSGKSIMEGPTFYSAKDVENAVSGKPYFQKFENARDPKLKSVVTELNKPDNNEYSKTDPDGLKHVYSYNAMDKQKIDHNVQDPVLAKQYQFAGFTLNNELNTPTPKSYSVADLREAHDPKVVEREQNKRGYNKLTNKLQVLNELDNNTKIYKLPKNPNLGIIEFYPNDDHTTPTGIPIFSVVALNDTSINGHKLEKGDHTGDFIPQNSQAARNLFNDVNNNNLSTYVDKTSSLSYASKVPKNNELTNDSHVDLHNLATTNGTKYKNALVTISSGQIANSNISNTVMNNIKPEIFNSDIDHTEMQDSTVAISKSKLFGTKIPVTNEPDNNVTVRESSIKGGNLVNSNIQKSNIYVDPKTYFIADIVDNSRVENRTVTPDQLVKAINGESYPYEQDQMDDMISNSTLKNTHLYHDHHTQFTVDKSNLQNVVSATDSEPVLVENSTIKSDRLKTPIVLGSGAYSNDQITTKNAGLVFNTSGFYGESGQVVKDQKIDDSNAYQLNQSKSDAVMVNTNDPTYKAVASYLYNNKSAQADIDKNMSQVFDLGAAAYNGDIAASKQQATNVKSKALETDITDDAF